MSEAPVKDNMWLYVGLCIVGMVAVVIFLKSQKSAHLESGAVAQLQSETFANLEKRKTSNNASEMQKSGK